MAETQVNGDEVRIDARALTILPHVSTGSRLSSHD